jgi:hypothetical protein
VELITGIAETFPLSFGQNVSDPAYALVPNRLVLIEQPAGFLQPFMVTPHDLLPSALFLGDQGGALQHRNMLLDGGETHGVKAREAGDCVFSDRHPADNVPPGGIGERLEKAVKFGFAELIYNHLVVR